MKETLRVEYVPIELLTMCEQNPRKNDANVEALVKSITAFGWTNPILARRENRMVIAGHARLKAAKAKGLDKVPVIFLDL
ncbi:MAG: ParB N-terminal domain-containing protein, partial [Planctomycetota bacterium]